MPCDIFACLRWVGDNIIWPLVWSRFKAKKWKFETLQSSEWYGVCGSSTWEFNVCMLLSLFEKVPCIISISNWLFPSLIFFHGLFTTFGSLLYSQFKVFSRRELVDCPHIPLSCQEMISGSKFLFFHISSKNDFLS